MKTWGTRENTMRKPSPKCFENIEENVSRESLVFCLEMFCSNAGREKRTFTNTQRNELGNSATYIALVHGVNISNVGDFILEY